LRGWRFVRLFGFPRAIGGEVEDSEREWLLTATKEFAVSEGASRKDNVLISQIILRYFKPRDAYDNASKT
jgi:hypothetical protein